jgi:hypothetical protein
VYIFTFLQTVIKELNLKFKTKETPHGIKREIAFNVEVMNYAEKHGSEASNESNCEDDFSGSDDNFLGFYDE